MLFFLFVRWFSMVYFCLKTTKTPFFSEGLAASSPCHGKTPRFLPAPGPPAAAKAKTPLPPSPKTPTAPPALAAPPVSPAAGGGFFWEKKGKGCRNSGPWKDLFGRNFRTPPCILFFAMIIWCLIHIMSWLIVHLAVIAGIVVSVSVPYPNTSSCDVVFFNL